MLDQRGPDWPVVATPDRTYVSGRGPERTTLAIIARRMAWVGSAILEKFRRRTSAGRGCALLSKAMSAAEKAPRLLGYAGSACISGERPPAGGEDRTDTVSQECRAAAAAVLRVETPAGVHEEEKRLRKS